MLTLENTMDVPWTACDGFYSRMIMQCTLCSRPSLDKQYTCRHTHAHAFVHWEINNFWVEASLFILTKTRKSIAEVILPPTRFLLDLTNNLTKAVQVSLPSLSFSESSPGGKAYRNTKTVLMPTSRSLIFIPLAFIPSHPLSANVMHLHKVYVFEAVTANISKYRVDFFFPRHSNLSRCQSVTLEHSMLN